MDFGSSYEPLGVDALVAQHVAHEVAAQHAARGRA